MALPPPWDWWREWPLCWLTSITRWPFHSVHSIPFHSFHFHSLSIPPSIRTAPTDGLKGRGQLSGTIAIRSSSAGSCAGQIWGPYPVGKAAQRLDQFLAVTTEFHPDQRLLRKAA